MSLTAAPHWWHWSAARSQSCSERWSRELRPLTLSPRQTPTAVFESLLSWESSWCRRYCNGRRVNQPSICFRIHHGTGKLSGCDCSDTLFRDRRFRPWCSFLHASSCRLRSTRFCDLDLSPVREVGDLGGSRGNVQGTTGNCRALCGSSWRNRGSWAIGILTGRRRSW